jgi:predicted dehydrogenase
MKPVSILVIGAGGRGKGYATFALEQPDRARVVGVAEPKPDHRQFLVENHSISEANTFSDWREAADQPRLADAVIISTQDAMHADPAVAFAEKGYAILLEKPMAPNAADCLRIVEAVRKSGVMLAVCHVMRYTHYTQTVKNIIDSGTLGRIVSLQHLEPVGYWHQAHSFVRGNWRNEAESSSMLLAKSVHDLDWIRYVIGSPCRSVSSFGSLAHFKPEDKPEGAADRCLDCGVEADCPYSAKRLYLGKIRRGETGWPLSAVTLYPTEESVTFALRNGPYGRCVYACDNDVVDHQVVNMEFAGGQTAVFTMTAFTEMAQRKTRIFGTRGQLEGDGEKITVYDFLTERKTTIDTVQSDGSALGGHGGGDYGLLDHFIQAVATSDPKHILSGVEESYETHRMVFAAEQARKEHRVVDIS